MTDEDLPPPMAPGQWMAFIRSADIDLEFKGALLILGSYADFETNPDKGKVAGEHVHPGADRFAKDLRRSNATARRYLTRAKEAGAIVLVRRGNYRKKRSDEYRLTLTVETMKNLGIPDPDEYKELIGEDARSRRSAAKTGRVRRSASPEAVADSAAEVNQRSSKVSVNEPVDNSSDDSDQRSSRVSVNSTEPDPTASADQRSPWMSAKTPIDAQTEVGLTLTLDERPPSMSTPTIFSSTEHESVDLRTDLAVVAHPQAAEQDPDSTWCEICGQGTVVIDGEPVAAVACQCSIRPDEPPDDEPVAAPMGIVIPFPNRGAA